MKSMFIFLTILIIICASGGKLNRLGLSILYILLMLDSTLGELYDDTYEEDDFNYYKSEAPRRLRGDQCSNLNKKQCKTLRLPCTWEKKTGRCIRLGQPPQSSNGCTVMRRQQCMRVRGCKWHGGHCNRINYHEV